MKLYAQQGYGTGDEPNKILKGLEAGYIHGAIISPKDYRLCRVTNLLGVMSDQFPTADRLFDPQFYASLITQDPNARMGRLQDGEYPYFAQRRRGQLESEAQIVQDLRRCLEFQKDLNVSAVIAPNILIRRSLNSIEAVIAKNFVRNAREIWNEIGDGRRLLVTIAVDAEALQDKDELMEFLADLTILEERPDGFYLLVASPTSLIRPELIDFRTLAGWMLMNHALSLNGFEVVNGFSDVLTPFLAAAGGSAGATGWWSNLKVFSMDRFNPASGGGRRPVWRYLSKALLNSIRYDELQSVRDYQPAVLNDLPTDAFYNPENGSEPTSQVNEVLQTWNAVSSFAGVDDQPDLEDCRQWIAGAKELYGNINTSVVRLMERSNDAHLDSLEDGLQLFAQLAELDA